jgi:fungal STAND N-terminal Goodbye domain
MKQPHEPLNIDMAYSAQFLAIWSLAKKRYAEETGDDLDHPAIPHPSSIGELKTLLEHQNHNFEAFRMKGALIFDSLNALCRPIQLLADLAAGGAALTLPPSTACFGAVTYLIKAAEGVSASYDDIIDLTGKLEDFRVRMTVHN